ncbi:MAG: PqiC family protein, partial [Thermodesulfobacteriota bacterium]
MRAAFRNPLNRFLRWLFPLLLAALFLLPVACGRSLPTRFYLLTPQKTGPGAAPTAGPSVGVGPVELPDYLDRPQILTRAGEHEIHFAEFDQW